MFFGFVVNKSSKGRKASKSASKASKSASKASKSERKSRTGRRESRSSARDREIYQPDFDDAAQDPPLPEADQDPRQDPPSDSDSDSHHSEGSQNPLSSPSTSNRYNSDFDHDEEDELSETDAAYAETAEDGVKLRKNVEDDGKNSEKSNEMAAADSGGALVSRASPESHAIEPTASVITIGEDDSSSESDVQITHQTPASGTGEISPTHRR